MTHGASRCECTVNLASTGSQMPAPSGAQNH